MGEARPAKSIHTYWLGGVVPRGALGVALASRVFRRRITGRERAPVDSAASRCTMLPFASASLARGGLVAGRRGHVSPCGGLAAGQSVGALQGWREDGLVSVGTWHGFPCAVQHGDAS